MITIFGATDTGLTRKINQDRFIFEILGDDFAYVVLCDGMGGPAGGHVASETATHFVREVFSRDLKESLSEQSLRSVMLSAAAGANSLIYDAARREPNLLGMGTTLIVAVFRGDYLYIVYAGDSRVYHIREEKEEQITRDHTVVQMLVDSGEITEEDAKEHPKRHYITKAVGVGPMVDTDFLVQEFAPGDKVLLCSDGLYNYLTEGSLPDLLEDESSKACIDRLIELAKEGGGSDNITAVLVTREETFPDDAA